MHRNWLVVRFPKDYLLERFLSAGTKYKNLEVADRQKLHCLNKINIVATTSSSMST